MRVTRRRFLGLVGATGAAGLWWTPGCGDDDSGAAQIAHFFTTDERLVVEDMAAALVPEDDLSAGALATDAVELIDRFLAAFDSDPPSIFGGGPYSGRSPFPDPRTGLPGDDHPDNDFTEMLPLTRMQELAFRILLDGDAAVTNGTINAGIVSPNPGLRAIYREGIEALEQAARDAGAVNFAHLDAEARLAAFATTAPEFRSALLQNLAEGMFAAPEYGGNRDRRGWLDYDYDGDSQPLGYTLFDADGEPFDRADKPNQTADPNRPARPFSPEVERFLAAITAAQGGKRFF